MHISSLSCWGLTQDEEWGSKMLKHKLRNLLLDFDVMAFRATPAKDVEDFVKKLKPVNVQRRLIRVGGDGDGGYLVPDDLDGLAGCFSPGVDVTASFETDLLQRGVPSYLADKSVDAPPPELDRFTFDKKFLGASDNEEFMTLESWFRKYVEPSNQSDFLLQMDIEGAEYGVLLNCPAWLLKRFRIVVMEFHNLFSLYEPVAFSLMRDAINKLLDDFYVVHIHPNNCSGTIESHGLSVPGVVEMTFLRKDRPISRDAGALSFPHPLDRRCIASRDEVVLPDCWYN